MISANFCYREGRRVEGGIGVEEKVGGLFLKAA
jgi:hypothetical protein